MCAVEPRSKKLIHVYLAVENRLMREALGRLFQKQADLTVVGQRSSREATPRQVVGACCDVLVLDSLETESAVSLLHEVACNQTPVRIILFGMEEDLDCFLRAVWKGISGYLLKEASSAEVVSAVRSVARGEAVSPGRLCMGLFDHVRRGFRQRAGLADEEAGLKLGLTFRQRQLISLIAKGMTNKEIASNLNLSECTVKNHVYRIMKHVEAESRQDAVDLVRSKGYLSSI